MKIAKTMSLPKAVKVMLALTPTEKRLGRGDLPKTSEGIPQPGQPGLLAIFKHAEESFQNAKLQARKTKEKTSDK